MDNNYSPLSDVERDKELFEYEMTQVILQLKGEFAKVSGKDLGLEETDLSAPEISISSEIPAVELNYSADVALDKVSNINEYEKISVSLDTTKNNPPMIPTVNAFSAAKVKMSPFQSDSPVIKSVNPIKIDDVKLSFQNISIVSVDISLPILNGETINIEQVNNVKTADLSILLPNNTVNVGLNNFGVSIPEATVPSSYSSSVVNIIDTHVEMPNVTGSVIYQEKKIDTACCDVSVPETEYKPVNLDIKCNVDKIGSGIASPNINIPVINAEVYIKPADIEVPTNTYSPVSCDLLGGMKCEIKQTNEISSVEVPIISKYNATTSKKPDCNLTIPQTSSIHTIELSAVTIENSRSIGISNIPNINLNTSSTAKIEVQRTNINSEYKTIVPLSIPDVDLKPKTMTVDVITPNFNEMIETLLRDIV